MKGGIVMTPKERRQLEREFHKGITNLCTRSKKELRYNPRDFIGMMHKYGVTETCRRLLWTPKIPDGFLNLLAKKRLDLTFEAYVYDNPKFSVLFTAEEFKTIIKRLTDYKYIP